MLITSKYQCYDNLNKMYKNINFINNQNIKIDYTKIYNILLNELELIEKNIKNQTDKSQDLYLLNYEIENHILKIQNHLT